MTGERWTSENNPGLSAEVILKADKAVKLVAAGLTYEQIAEQVGYANRASAHRAVKAALRRISNSADVVERRAVVSEQLDYVWRKNVTKAGDPKADATLLKSRAQYAALWGLNANEAKVAEGIQAAGMAQLATASMLSALLIAAMGKAGVDPDMQVVVVEHLNAELAIQGEVEDEETA